MVVGKKRGQMVKDGRGERSRIKRKAYIGSWKRKKGEEVKN